jgi:hypothetical protein
MGYDPDQQNKALAGLIKNISAAGGSLGQLGKTSDQQAASVLAYIKQQDEVTRLTGLTAEAQGKAFEKAQTNDRFAIASFRASQELEKAQAAQDAETAQGKERIADAQAYVNKLTMVASLADKIGGNTGKALLDMVSGPKGQAGAFTKEAQQAFITFGPQIQQILLSNRRDTTQQGIELLGALKQTAGQRIDAAGNLIQLSQDKTVYGDAQELTKLAGMTITKAGDILTQTKPIDASGKPKGTEADLANVVGIRQNLLELNSAIQKFINEGIGPVTNQILGFTQELRTKGTSISDFLKIPDNLTKEQRARYEAETGAGSSVQDIFKGRSEAFERNKEALRETTKAGIETVTTNIVDPIVNTFKEAGKGAADALDDVTKTLKRSLDGLGDMLRNWNRTVPLPPTSGVSFNSSSMSRLLNEYRAAAGPENRFEPSLVDAVYRPDVTNRENQPLADFRDEAGQASSAQMVAYETMIRQQSELIDLLQKSVGIQDRTLRATYNA